jgi:RNA polymerase sigma-70 factor (ECF subfamily)
MNDQPTDATLIAESIELPDRFGQVFDRHYGDVRAFAWRRLGADHADDVAAEVFARAFSQRVKYDVAEPDAAPWLFGIASNLVRMQARTESRRLRALARSGGVPEGDF